MHPPPHTAPEPSVLGMLMLVHVALQVKEDDDGVGALVARGLAQVPGVRAARVRFTDEPVESVSTVQIAIATPRTRYGSVDVDVADPDTWALYEPFVRNLAGSIALWLENLRQRRALERALEELSARTDQLAEANEELEAFSYSVSHDLRGPVRAVIGYTQIVLRDHASELGPEVRGHLERVARSGARMDALIDDLLRLARVTRAPMHDQPVDLAVLARGLIAELRERDPARNVDVTLPDDAHVRGDESLLRVLLCNLLENAWKFTALREDARVEFGRHDGAWYVRDNGDGFDMAYASRLFRPFERLHTRAQFEGSGVGLAIVERIVRRHRGTVRAEGARGQGATFWFTLGPPASD
ncbi:MAG: sensor histidine kinase [Myxococcota bacterium]